MKFAKILLLGLIAIVFSTDVTSAARQAVGRDDRTRPNGTHCTVNGIVRNNRGEPVSGAVVRIAHRSGGPAGVSQHRTDDNGNFTFEPQPGVLHVIAQHRGDGRAVINTNTSINQILTLELSLQKGGHGRFGRTHRGFHLGTHHKK